MQVAETGSLSRAAETLELSNAAASRHLSALELRLGARLVERNTRRILSAKVLSFIDFIVEKFELKGYERKWTGHFGKA